MIVATAVIALVVVAPRMPTAICTGDSGDLQLAAATMGIAHPPGYAVYASIGYLVSRILWLDPAAAVSWFCLGTGVVVVIACIWLQIRLDVHAGLACCVALLFVAHPAVWRTLQIPEVYVPTLAFEAIGACLLLRYAGRGLLRDLMLSAFSWGIALAGRPPVLLILVFVVVAWLFARKRWQPSWRRSSRSLLACLAAGALPGLYTLGFLWIRDAPSTPYDYIEQYNFETKVLPSADEGWAAKARRVAWQISGAQYAGTMMRHRPGLRIRARWLANQLLPDRPLTLMLASFVVLVGGVLVFQRNPVAFWMLSGMALGGAAYLYVYPVHGDAADVLPILFAVVVGAGVALSEALPRKLERVRFAVAVALFATASVLTIVESPSRSCIGTTRNASAFLQALDMASLPEHASIYSTWQWSPALWYEALVRENRPDITIINADVASWPRMIGEPRGRFMLATEDFQPPSGCNLVPFRNVHRLECRLDTSDSG